MADSQQQQTLHNSVIYFVTAFKALQQVQTSVLTEQAIISGQILLQSLPVFSPYYSLCSCCLAHCLLITWTKTGAEQKRDRELLEIIGSRTNAAVNHCLPSDQYQSWYLSTQQDYHCIVRNFSARLEDDFWDHEQINTLNVALVYAKVAWQILRNNEVQAVHTAQNIGNLYMSRYTYFGRSGDLDDALRFSAMVVVMSSQKSFQKPFLAYVQQAMRLSMWCLYENHPDEMDDAIDYMSQVIHGRNWETENQGVTPQSGSSYAVALRFFSQIYSWTSIRRGRQISRDRKYLDLAVQYSQKACTGITEADPGTLLCQTELAKAHLQLYLERPSPRVMQNAVKTVVTALELSENFLSRVGMPSYNGVRMTGRGGSISSLISTDHRSSSNDQLKMKERSHQRWIMQVLEISADLLLARYQSNQNPQDLSTAITALKLSIQGTHGLSPARQKQLFKLSHALCEKLRISKNIDLYRHRNICRRLSHMKTATQSCRELSMYNFGDLTRKSDTFSPLSRCQRVVSVLSMEPIVTTSWQLIVPRGAYDRDLQFSNDAPNILISDVSLAAEHIQHLHYKLDPQIDNLLGRLPSDDPETATLQTMWNKIYCTAAASLKRAEVYQRALSLFLKVGDFETALELSDLAKVILGHLELHLMEPAQYLSEISHASNLATTMACIWLMHDWDPWTAIIALENGRELGSRNGTNALRSYGFEPVQELLPQVRLIRNQLQRSARIYHIEKSFTSDQSQNDSVDLMTLLKDVARSQLDITPFGRQKCMSEVGDGFIIHLITSKLGTYALITTSYDFQKLELLSCTHEHLCTRTINFRRAIEKCETQESQKGAANQRLRSLLSWLWKTVAKPIVQFLNLKRSNEGSFRLPRVKWIACGIFSQLPIHAAGVYFSPTSDYLDQYAVSSYLSSIRGSLTIRQRKPLMPYYQNARREFTLFGMSTSPAVPEGKLADLAVTEERERIFASLGDTFTNNTIDNCNLGMARNMMHWARIIHFTCHGLPHPTDPLKSRLVLPRDDKEPCTVAQIRDMEIPNALLLFLSACHSAIDPRAGETDEITHIAKAFLLAGFPNVIGTLWKAYQASALEIAAVFYAQVAKEWRMDQDEPDSDVFPRALHHAICKWRDDDNLWKPMDWASWVCFTG